MKLYICSTYYHVYIAFLKRFSAAEETVDLVVCDDIPNAELLLQRIVHTALFRNVWFVPQKKLPVTYSRNIWDSIFFQHRRSASILRPLLPFNVTDYQDIYIFHDGTTLGSYLNDEKRSYHLIEDSLNFYQYVYRSSHAHLMYPKNLRYKIRRLLRAGYFPLGFSPYLLDIEVNDKNNLEISSKKVIESPRAELEKCLSPDRIQLLMEVFGYSCPEFSDSLTAIILTEPLFLDKFCSTEEAQHTVYRSMTEFLLAEGFFVYIKPHPRDTTDYSSYPATLIDRFFPSELFRLQGNQLFDWAVTVTSSALENFPAKKRYYWDISQKTIKNKV